MIEQVRSFNRAVTQRIGALNDQREVVADEQARYFGAKMSENSLVPLGEAQLGQIRFEDWLKQTAKAASQAG
jgi:hypothetical protein